MIDKSALSFKTPINHPMFIDLTGRQFCRLTVLGYAGNKKWFCECICGSITSVSGDKLKTGRTKSCGCLRNVRIGDYNRTHGESRRTPEYAAYQNAKNRCRNVRDAKYPRWGGRGIEFRFNSFEEFLACVGRRPEGDYSLDRIDNDGHYEAGNLRWAERIMQARNTRRSHILTVNGESRCVPEWAEVTGISIGCLDRRTRLGWCDRCCVTIPVGQGVCQHKTS